MKKIIKIFVTSVIMTLLFANVVSADQHFPITQPASVTIPITDQAPDTIDAE